jgi:other hect domain ubiquitin protein ligase E3
MIKPMLSNNKNQDQALPKADTCFFNIELPDYSTKGIMKEKILLAVNLDNVSINADENNNEDNPLMN